MATDSATTAVSTTVKKVSNTNLLDSAIASFKELLNVSLPLPNELSDYATYTYVVSIGVLTADDLNNPDGTYMAGKRIPLLCKTAGGDPNNRIQTPYGKFEFYVDNIKIDSVIGFSVNKNTNVATMEFDIYEPYSMGMFMVALQTASQQAGYTNWREVPLLMTISFQGNTQAGLPLDLAKTTRYIPFRVGEMSMNTTEKGTRYHFTGYAHNAIGQTEEKSSLKSDTAVKGKTVQEVLQTGEKSLQAVVNERLRQYKDDGIVEVPDEIVILFPIDSSSASTNSGNNSSKESSTTATSSTTGSGSDIYKKLGLVRDSTTKNLIQSSGQCNSIGKQSMGYDMKKKSEPAMAKDDSVYNSKTGTWDQSKNTYDATEGNLKFTQDIDIPTAINQVILASNYPNVALDKNTVDSNGMRPMWKVDTQVFDIDSDANMAKTGTKPRLIVYRVVQYDVHSSHMATPNTKPPGIDSLTKQLVKVYDYIYTGKNTEVLKFNIDFSYGFNNIFPADNFKRTQDAQLQSKYAGTFRLSDISNMVGDLLGGGFLGGLVGGVIGGIIGDIPGAVKSVFAGYAPSKDIGAIPTQISFMGTKVSTDGQGGGGLENVINRSARYMFDAFTSPNNMVNLDMEILGDPFWIAQSGVANYTGKMTQFKDLLSDGSVNYQNGEVHVGVNFRTPIDINQATGLYDFGPSSTVSVTHFSGIYKVNKVTSTFNQGRFTQLLEGYRIPGQESKNASDPGQLFNINSLLDSVTSIIGGVFK
jgi:hypothetical protein